MDAVSTVVDPIDGVAVDHAETDGSGVGLHVDAVPAVVVQGAVVDCADHHRAGVVRIDRDRIQAGTGHTVVGDRRKIDSTGSKRSAVGTDRQMAARVIHAGGDTGCITYRSIVQERIHQTRNDHTTANVQSAVAVGVLAGVQDPVVKAAVKSG